MNRIAEMEKKMGIDIEELQKNCDEYKKVIIREQVIFK